MTVGSIIVIVICAILLVKNPKNFSFNMLMMGLFFAAFVQIGSFSTVVVNLSYYEVPLWLSIISGLLLRLKTKKGFKIEKGLFVSFLLLLIASLMGYLSLIIHKDEIWIVSNADVIDLVYKGMSSVVHPELTAYNWSKWKKVFTVLLALVVDRDYFYDKTYKAEILQLTKVFFHVVSVLILVEFLISNFIDSEVIRTLYTSIFGAGERVYTSTDMRFGYVSSFALFSEPSAAAIYLVYFATLFIDGISKDELKFFVLAILAILATGSTSCLSLLLFAIVIAILEYTPILEFTKEKFFTLLGGGTVVVICYLFIRTHFAKYIDIIKYEVNRRVATYLGLQMTSGSGAARQFGNQLCYDVFAKAPGFGIGIGSTRGLALLPGMLACYGLVGSATLLWVYKRCMNLSFKGKYFILAVVYLLYSTSLFSVFYTYSLAFAFLMIPFICRSKD